MTLLDASTCLEHLRRDSARFRAVLAQCDPTARVPACPDWDAADLLWHLSEVQWFWGTVIAGRPAGPPEVHPERPASHAALLTTYDEHSALLLDALAGADPAEPAWSWAREQTVGFSFRRQAHEALVHRLDAEQTAGAVTALDPTLAADGVAEALDVMYGGDPPAWGGFQAGPGLLRISLTDVGVELWVQPGEISGSDPGSDRVLAGPHLLLVDDPGTPPAATISGTAGDVDAWLWKRVGDAGLTRGGDAAVLAAFDAAVAPAID